MTRVPSAGLGPSVKLALKLSRVPSLSAAIWWHTVHEMPSAASAWSLGLPLLLPAIGRWENTSPRLPDALATRCAIGMWHAAHSSWISAAWAGWSMVSRLTPACQYGSRAELAIIVDRQLEPIETSSPA